MSNIIEGNILDVTDGIIMQQVNCLGVMGAGVALAIRNKYEKVFTEYSKYVNKVSVDNRINLLGNLQIVRVTPTLLVANSFSQFDTSRTRKCTEEDILISNIKTVSSLLGDKMLYVPYNIGCALGGGDWNYVYSNIKDIDNLTIVKLIKNNER